MTHLVRLLFLVLLVLAVVVVVGLLVVRVGREALERRRRRRLESLRSVILTALMGEPDEAARARSDLRSRSEADWGDVEEQALAMIPKIKGDSHDELISLLLSRGATGRAGSLARSRSQVRRARGAYRLGTLAQRDSLSPLFALLRDRAFLVRRMAVRALGQVGDPLAVEPLLDAVTADNRLTRDVLAAIGRIGPVAGAPLRRELRNDLDTADPGRRAALTAMGLGLLADLSAVPLLVEALADRTRPGLAQAAAEALGSVGAPESVASLLDAVTADDPAVRAAAARALGQVGDVRAATGLAEALTHRHHESSRAVAGALLRLGAPGLAALDRSDSPYAAEALAVHRVRAGA